MAHIRESRPDFGLDLLVKILRILKIVSAPLLEDACAQK
jgi:hypothetical protein